MVSEDRVVPVAEVIDKNGSRRYSSKVDGDSGVRSVACSESPIAEIEAVEANGMLDCVVLLPCP